MVFSLYALLVRRDIKLLTIISLSRHKHYYPLASHKSKNDQR
jgi:hypothetical protein